MPIGEDYNPTNGQVQPQSIAMLGLFYESAADNLTAHAGGGQSSAFQITTQTARITTVVNPGDSIALPPSQAGLELLIVNHGANPMQVFGNAAEGATIDDVAAGIGVSQMASSIVIYTCPSAGKWYTEGLANGYAGGLQTVSSLDGIAAAGTTQGTATVLPPRMMYNVTSGGNNAAVLLPPSVSGAEITVLNNQGSGNNTQVFPNGTDKINTGAAGASFLAAPSVATIFFCATAGQWFTK